MNSFNAFISRVLPFLLAEKEKRSSLENTAKFASVHNFWRRTRNALSDGGLSAPDAAGGARSPTTHRTFLRAASSRVVLALRPRVGSDAFALQPPWKARLQPRAPEGAWRANAKLFCRENG